MFVEVDVDVDEEQILIDPALEDWTPSFLTIRIFGNDGLYIRGRVNPNVEPRFTTR